MDEPAPVRLTVAADCNERLPADPKLRVPRFTTLALVSTTKLEPVAVPLLVTDPSVMVPAGRRVSVCGLDSVN